MSKEEILEALNDLVAEMRKHHHGWQSRWAISLVQRAIFWFEKAPDMPL